MYETSSIFQDKWSPHCVSHKGVIHEIRLSENPYLGEGEIFGARTIEKIANAHQKCYVEKAIKVLNV